MRELCYNEWPVQKLSKKMLADRPKSESDLDFFRRSEKFGLRFTTLHLFSSDLIRSNIQFNPSNIRFNLSKIWFNPSNIRFNPSKIQFNIRKIIINPSKIQINLSKIRFNLSKIRFKTR